ncbi:MAG: hypothetical protein QOF39_3587 [Frankiales bacterium]|nr:hypothetical protein [Frankiales bacterium]
MISKNRLAVAAISAGLVTSMLGMGAAQADPVGAPSPRAINGVGSDTTQDVMNQVANDVAPGGVKALGSWNATGSATITTKPGCTLNRPNGSGAGVTALNNSLVANDGCVQFARSSSGVGATTPAGLTYIPFATDSVSYAVTSTSGIPRALTKANLIAIYHCDPTLVGTGPNWDITPVLPQSGSGTRSYWEGQMGILDADVNANAYPCIINGSKNGQLIEEHSGTAMDDKSIEPYSIAQYTDQSNGLVIDKRGRTTLGVIDGTDPQLSNGNFSVKRNVYNVIPTSKVADSTYASIFVGAGSLICADSATIVHYGFGVNPNCGDTTSHS